MKEKFKEMFKVLDDINTEEATKESKQSRGRAFESLLLDVFHEEGILQKRNRHTKDRKSEEIDGVIEVYNRIFLIESKWVTSGMAASVLYSFIGKIENKFHGTLGVFISRNPLKKNFLKALNKGRRQSVIVIHGKDVDLLFEGKSTFSEYIEYTFKELSSDNIVHIPVEEYIKQRELKKSSKVLIEKVESADKKGLKFVKQKLLSGPMSSTEMIVELGDLGQEEKDKAFIFLIQKYSELWFGNITGGQTFIIKNINAFLDSHEPTPEILKQLAPEYYTNLFFKSAPLYAREGFINEFSKFYSLLKPEVKKQFETNLLNYWNVNFGNYAIENNITDLIIPIWNEISDELRKELYKGFLDIYVSDRKTNHSQKKFAIELVDGNKIPLELVKVWLKDKLKSSGKMYFKLSVEKIGFIVSTYQGVLKLIEPDENKWPKYVLASVFERRTFNEKNDKIVLTGSQKLNIVNVEAYNGENLMAETIMIRHSYIKGGETNSYTLDLVSNLPDPVNHWNNQLLPVNKIFENGDNDRTEIKFENLKKLDIKVLYRIMD